MTLRRFLAVVPITFLCILCENVVRVTYALANASPFLRTLAATAGVALTFALVADVALRKPAPPEETAAAICDRLAREDAEHRADVRAELKAYNQRNGITA